VYLEGKKGKGEEGRKDERKEGFMEGRKGRVSRKVQMREGY
jgi:hypothetical protein